MPNWTDDDNRRRAFRYDRQAILADALSRLVNNPRTGKNVLLLWEEQMERLLGHHYRITDGKRGMRRTRFLADADDFLAACVEQGADPFRVIFAIFAHARWMRANKHKPYKPFPSQLSKVVIFTWWKRWEKWERVEHERGGYGTDLLGQSALSSSSDRRPLRFREPSRDDPIIARLQSKTAPLSVPRLKAILVAGINRLVAYRRAYPRLETADIIESYGEQIPRIVRWLLRDSRVVLSEPERRFLSSRSEREFLAAQLRQYEPTFTLPDLET